MTTPMLIEVVYASPTQQVVRSLTVAQATSVAAAIAQSGILTAFPEINLHENAVGIFSKLVTLETTVYAGDRIEIYRDLTIDPKARRRLRSEKAG